MPTNQAFPLENTTPSEIAPEPSSGVRKIATPQVEVMENDRTRKWIRRVARRSIPIGAFLLDLFPKADRDGMQVFRPDIRALRNSGLSTVHLDDDSPWTNWRRGVASFDGRLTGGEWESGRGRHEIKFDFDEWIYVLEGSVEITVKGRTTVLSAGDSALFRAGLTMRWNVRRYVRKIWVHRYSRPNWLERGVLTALRWLTPSPMLAR